MTSTSKNRVINLLTILVCIVWIGSLICRALYVSSAAQFASIDAGILVVLGYWFAFRKNGNGNTKEA